MKIFRLDAFTKLQSPLSTSFLIICYRVGSGESCCCEFLPSAERERAPARQSRFKPPRQADRPHTSKDSVEPWLRSTTGRDGGALDSRRGVNTGRPGRPEIRRPTIRPARPAPRHGPHSATQSKQTIDSMHLHVMNPCALHVLSYVHHI